MTRFSSEWWWYGFTHFFIPLILTAFGIAIFTKRMRPEKDPGFFARFLEGLPIFWSSPQSSMPSTGYSAKD
jgi:hypothetical protein